MASVDGSKSSESKLGRFFNRVFSRFCAPKSSAVEIISRKPGIVSADAVRWFVERDKRTLLQSVSFVPWIIRRGIRSGSVLESTQSVVAFRGEGAVVFCDASGFTKLTEYLAQKPNGAELLSSVMNQFFTPLIDIIGAYRGDIIKFSGDALTILFVSDHDEYDEENEEEIPCGSAWARCSGHSDLELAVLRATACCLEIHKRLDNFETGIGDKKLSFHIGVGCGTCTVLHLGGEASPEDLKIRRFEYVLAGDPLDQIAHACKYADVYETVLSPQAYELVKDTVVEGPSIEQDPSYKKISGFITSKHTFPTIRAAAEASDRHAQDAIQLSELNLTRRYIPSAVFQQMANGTLEYVNEIRNVTVFFICISGLDVASPEGAGTAQDLMSSVQQACFQQEGQVNKFLVDDKGLLFLCVFGAPPLVHTDDPLRAINACFSIIQSLKRLGVVGSFGLATGRVFCGMVGSSARQEYTTLGDCVNLAARLMQLGHPNAVIVDEVAYSQTKADLDYEVLQPVKLKGKDGLIPVYKPQVKQVAGALVNEGVEAGNMDTTQKLSRRRTNVVDIVESNAFLGDPLIECSQWRELKLTKRVLDDHNFIKAGGTLVFGGASGLGKDQLSHFVIDVTRKTFRNKVATVYATDRGLPRDRARPIIELIDTCISVATSWGFLDDYEGLDKLEQLAKLIDEPIEDIREGAVLEDNMIDMPLLNNYAAGTSSDATAGLPNTLPAVSIGSATLSPSLPGRKMSRYLSIQEDADHKLSAREMQVPFENQFIGYCERLVLRLLQARPIVLVMRISRGTSLFNIISNPTFWRLARRMSQLSLEGTSSRPNPLTLLVLCRRAEDASPAVLPGKVHRIEVQPLSRNCLEEYIARILKLDSEEEAVIPPGLLAFVEDLTQGNPLYVLETLEQLVSKKYISRTSDGSVKVEVPDLTRQVSVSDWNHTSMVGRVICQLEALAPQEAAIVKMASVFEGPFSVLDIAASLKSPFLKAQRFDNYRMYRTCARLVRLGILSEIPQYAVASSSVPVNDASRFGPDTDGRFIESIQNIPMFILDNLLIRKVAGSMVLHQQALKIKRQALMHRVIYRDVPERMAALKQREDSLKTPYYDLVKLGAQ